MAALSRLPVGSSARTMSGSLASARAIATRWRCPPDRADGRWPARSARPTCASNSTALRRAAPGERPAKSAGSSTFSRALSSSMRWKAWKTKPISLRRISANARSLSRSIRPPRSRNSPPDGRSSPPRRWSNVDFPQPLGPITATVSPRAISRSMPSTARTSPSSRPYSLRRLRARAIGSSVTVSCSFDRSNSVRRPPASASPLGALARCPRAAGRRSSDPVRP